MTDNSGDEKWQIGAEKLTDVYQGMVSVVPPGLMDFSDIMTRDLFGGFGPENSSMWGSGG